MMTTPDVRVILCTASREEAEQLARRLLEAHLIGCANLIGGVTSLYWWEGAVTSDQEVVMLMETTAERQAEAMTSLAAWHSYDVPKIVALCPSDVSEPYRTWLRSATQSGE